MTEDDYAFNCEFGKRLAAARIAKRLTQAQLGKLLNVTHGCIGNWEVGETTPSIRKLPQLEKALGVSVGMLLPTLPATKQNGTD